MSFVVYELGEPHPWPETPGREARGTEPAQGAGRLGQNPRQPIPLRPRARPAFGFRAARTAYGKGGANQATQREPALTAEQIMSAP